MAPALIGRISSPLVSNHTLRGSDFSSPELGTREGHAYFVRVLTVKIRQPSHEFTFGVGMNFIPYPLVLTPVV
jgi:hypothetical protein